MRDETNNSPNHSPRLADAEIVRLVADGELLADQQSQLDALRDRDPKTDSRIEAERALREAVGKSMGTATAAPPACVTAWLLRWRKFPITKSNPPLKSALRLLPRIWVTHAAPDSGRGCPRCSRSQRPWRWSRAC